MEASQGEVRRDATRDAEVFDALYPELRRFAAVVGGLDVDPDDLVQEAVARALRRGPLSELDNPGAYLRRAIVNLELNRRRSQERGQRAARRLDPGGGVLPTYPSDVDTLRVLSPAERAAVHLVVLERHSYRDAAAVLGVREAALRKRVTRAMARLRAALEDEHDG
jgi:RNA polymerase sigma-70 factor (ECF subfamily)